MRIPEQVDYRFVELSMLTNRSINEIKEEFGNVMQAAEEAQIIHPDSAKRVPRDLVYAWLYGTDFAYRDYFKVFNAESILKQYTHDYRIIYPLLQSATGMIDHWVLLKMAATLFIGAKPNKKLSEEFQANVEKPLLYYLKKEQDGREHWKKERQNAIKILKNAAKSIDKALDALESDCDQIVVERNYDIMDVKYSLLNASEAIDRL